MQKIEIDPAFLGRVRIFLEPYWRKLQDQWTSDVAQVVSEGMCRHTSAFLLTLLQEKGISGFVVRGGYVRFKDSELHLDRYEWCSARSVRDTRSKITYGNVSKAPDAGWWLFDAFYGMHWWLQSEDHVIDLTGDQFGWDPVFTGQIDDRYSLMPDLKPQTHQFAVQNVVKKWLRDWYADQNGGLAA